MNYSKILTALKIAAVVALTLPHLTLAQSRQDCKSVATLGIQPNQ